MFLLLVTFSEFIDFENVTGEKRIFFLTSAVGLLLFPVFGSSVNSFLGSTVDVLEALRLRFCLQMK